MDHTEAVNRQVSDRYLLGELSDSEIREFEEHYFGCQDCAAEVESGAILVENARAVLPEMRTAAFRADTGWRRWLADLRTRPMQAIPIFATCVLACVCAYQAFLLIPDLKKQAAAGNTAMALPSFALAGRTRGAETVIAAPRGARFLAVTFDLDPQTVYPQYRCELEDAGGATRFTTLATPPAAGEPVMLLLPAGKMAAGRYRLSVSGIPRAGALPVRVADYSFDFSSK